MQKVNSMTYGSLKNAEHVGLFTNIKIAIDKATAEKLGLTEAQYNSYVSAVANEQDIVNRSLASVYTPEMKALDEERDRIFKRIRHKLTGVTYASADDPVKAYENTIGKNLLGKYPTEIVQNPYQEESSVLTGFILDMHTFLDDDAIELLAITQDLADLERTNKGFADMYHERVVEKSGTDSEMAKQLRRATEEQFALLACHVEFKANHDTTLIGASNLSLLKVINQLIYDAQLRLDVRLGRKSEVTTEDAPATDEGGNVDVPVFNK